ncbi:formylmethanofuran dehydrogenase subunit A [Methylomonas rosea]|uniref:Formylmethanofuran dehydrogenase subunit A n=1 Tax=Methylomonas rosea TaxID=2952227 RepID=A0ABT1TS29_9GAMM|nr:formylmethanofuran dehydrogenase subunit A [Methylomonas sp. WSC-7]MCQ8117575.1 formylmethanofuran dehydrogenase subunit A [Methylomonas sp. WSC-7]
MLIKLAGGHIYDPTQNRQGEPGDLFIRDGLITSAPGTDAKFDQVYDLSGHIVMAGAVDIHTHIAGGNVNTARLLLPEQHRNHVARRLRTALDRATLPGSIDTDGEPVDHPFSNAKWSTTDTGYRYARMGYTTVVEPAMLPINALDVHLQMADIPILDTAALAILGNDDLLLRLMRAKASQSQINDYVAWTLHATRALGLKVINAGGANAFKSNARHFALDDIVPDYGVSSRQILQTLQTAVCQLGVPHPVHVHCNNLGIPGNVDTIVATMEAAQGLPMHLAHVQFYAYGNEGAKGFSSAAAQLLEAFNRHPNITMDVGQVLFGQTVTISGDVIAQYSRHADASPGKWVMWDAECEGSGGVVPYRYREASFVNTLQWAIGLELFLLAEAPERLFFTTDHPNGAPFTAYPELIRLLMDADYRQAYMARLNQEALAMTLLPNLKREFTLTEIATMTRSAAANLLGLHDRGHLAPGAIADIAVYDPQGCGVSIQMPDPFANRAKPDYRAMFADAALVFKNGRLMVRDGEVIARPAGHAQTIQPALDQRIERDIQNHFDRFYSLKLNNFKIEDVDISRDDHQRFQRVGLL